MNPFQSNHTVVTATSRLHAQRLVLPATPGQQAALKQTTLKQAFILSCLCAALAMVSGCADKGIKPETHTPTKLLPLAQNPNILTPVLTTTLPGSSKLAALSRFEVGFAGSQAADAQLVVAANAGQVTGFTLAGQRLWSLTLPDVIVGGVSVDAASQTAIVTTKAANAVAIDTTTGAIRWQTKLTGSVLSPALMHNNRVVLMGNDGAVYGLSLQTGAIIWQFGTQTPSISVRGSAKPTLLDDSTTLVASADGRLHALDIETGIPKWSRRVGVPTGASEIQRMTDVDGTPVIDEQQLFAVSYSGQLLGVDLASRQVLFVQEAASNNSLALTDTAVIVTTLTGLVQAYDRQTGALLWENKDLAYRELSNPVRLGAYIAIGDLDGVLHLLSATDGHIVSRTQAKGAINYLKAQAGYLLTQTASGQVNAWRIAS